MNFENLVLGKVFYSYILDIVFGIYIVVLILYIICRYAKKELVDAFHLNIIFIKFVPRILINVIIIFFVYLSVEKINSSYFHFLVLKG